MPFSPGSSPDLPGLDKDWVWVRHKDSPTGGPLGDRHQPAFFTVPAGSEVTAPVTHTLSGGSFFFPMFHYFKRTGERGV